MSITPVTTILKDSKANDAFFKKGYALSEQIDKKSLDRITALNQQLSIPDYFGCGFNVGMNSDIISLRMQMQDEIKSILAPFVESLLYDFIPYTASFLNKHPRKDCFVIAHQDFTYTDETLYPSFMCFIPLVDTTIKNAALGFVPGSHLYYDNIRAFPFPGVPTPVTENSVELMQYFDIVEMKAGQIIFFSHNTIHGSFSNYSNATRPAVGMSFIKKNTSPYLFLHNPKTAGKTILQYEVDTYSLVNYNNPTIKKKYETDSVDLPYPLINEFEYIGTSDNSWKGIKEKLDASGLYPNRIYTQLTDKYNQLTELKQKKGIYYRIKERLL